MFRGMTGFGRGEHRGCLVEISTVNRRHLEIQLALPPAAQPLMGEIRSWIAARVHRGQVKFHLTYEPDQAPAAELNEPLISQLSGLAGRLSELTGLDKRSAFSLIVGENDLLRVEREDVSTELLRPAVEAALDGVVAMREREGEAIGREVKERAARLDSQIDLIEELAPQIGERHRAQLEALIGTTTAEQLLIVASKVDIAEEINRFRLHLGQLQSCSSGKRGDFLLQEMLREVNTLAAKASDGQVASHAVTMKEELERLREQMQNVE